MLSFKSGDDDDESDFPVCGPNPKMLGYSLGRLLLKNTLLFFLGHLAFVLLQGSLQMLIFFLGPGSQTGDEIIFLRGGQSGTAPFPRPSGRLPGPPSGPEFEKTSRPSAGAEPPPRPPRTHCFSWASRSRTSASRLLTRATSSSSRSCSLRFWASVFCQSADGRLVIHRGASAHSPPFPPSPVSLTFSTNHFIELLVCCGEFGHRDKVSPLKPRFLKFPAAEGGSGGAGTEEARCERPA